MDFLVQKCSELGVSRIVPVVTARSVVRPEPGRRARWEKIAREAARQCGRADVPEVSRADAARGRAGGARAAGAAAHAVARRRAAGRCARCCPIRPRRRCWSGRKGASPPAEVEAARAAGFRAGSLGSRILRVETAAIVAVALAEEAFGALSPQKGEG